MLCLNCFWIEFNLSFFFFFFFWVFSTGSGDVDTSKVVKADADGCIRGASG